MSREQFLAFAFSQGWTSAVAVDWWSRGNFWPITCRGSLQFLTLLAYNYKLVVELILITPTTPNFTPWYVVLFESAISVTNFNRASERSRVEALRVLRRCATIKDSRCQLGTNTVRRENRLRRPSHASSVTTKTLSRSN